MEAELKKKYCKVYSTSDRHLFGTLWVVSIEEKDTETRISCTSNPFTLHEFSVPGGIDWYAFWTKWILPIHYELSRPFDQVHNSSSPEEQNRRGSGMSANGHLLYVRCPIHTAKRPWPRFATKIIQDLADMCPGMKLVHGKSRHSQSQWSVERPKQDVREMLVAWMSDKNTKTWS